MFLIILGIGFIGLKDVIFTDCLDIICLNWDLKLTKGSKEIYHQTSPSSFLGDGEKYHVFEYTDSDISNLVTWQYSKNTSISSEFEDTIVLIQESSNIEIPKEYLPNLNQDYKFYKAIKYDSSKLYIVHIENTNKVYILENIF